MSRDFPFFIFIIAGGSGERFWPLSKRQTPKHLLRLFSEKTLLEQTLQRLEGIVPIEQLFILTNTEQYAATCQAIPFFPKHQIIAEPAKRDTAPAAALATAIANSKNSKAVVALLPADQLIKDHVEFQKNLRDAATFAFENNVFVTLAINPTWPATGFGYMELIKKQSEGTNGTEIWQVGCFVEKPDSKTAQTYLDSGRFCWNAGMFIYPIDAFISEAKKQKPELNYFIQQFPNHSDQWQSFLKEYFPKLEKISIDYALMEHASRVFAAKAQFDWDDVGSWTSLPQHLCQDAHGNTLQGKTVIENAKNNIVMATSRTVALCGVEDLIIVETPEAVLICHQSKAQEIKNLLSKLPTDLT